jgi:hypothetical protein
MDNEVSLKILAVALTQVGTSDFERFGQAFYGALEGTEFVPLGGSGDGGADGLLERDTFESKDRSRVLQITKQQNLPSKIKDTVARLRQVGRNPTSLTMLVSYAVQNSDTLEDKMSALHSLRVRIRDARYVESQVNHNAGTRSAARCFLLPAADFLYEAGASRIISPSTNLPTPTLCAFLGQEIENRRGSDSLLESVSDSLILWALSDTDPNQNRFKTRQELLKDIETSLPAAKKFIRSHFDRRLDELSKKGAGGRKINYYRNGDKFCLPFETRQIIAEENAVDLTARNEVLSIFCERAKQINQSVSDQLALNISNVCMRSVERAFEIRGLDIVSFIEDSSRVSHMPTIDDIIIEVLEKKTDISGTEFSLARNVCHEILRRTFYHSEPIERRFLQKLSRTYTFLLIIKNEPKVVEYFQSITSQFVLYVGSDLIVRALSEFYLDEADQLTTNLLKILAQSGSKLILTEKALGEVCGNVRKANNAYKNEYGAREAYIDALTARHIDEILLRAYFYAKANADGSRKPSGWKDYISQFADFDEITRQGTESMKNFLCLKFKMEFESIDEMMMGVDVEKVDDLADKIQAVKHYPNRDIVLARNDALQILRIYAKRREMKETSAPNQFGYRTWWLTQESKVKRATVDLVRRHSARFLMAPEFLLSFIDVVPDLAAVRESFSDVFPTILGVKLSNRMKEADFLKILREYDRVSQLDPSRARAILAGLSNNLKGSSASDYLPIETTSLA